MARGPDKHFDPDRALTQAMLLFWEKGYAAASMAELQARMGLGAKSLYDTFGNKRQLYFRALAAQEELHDREDSDGLEKTRYLDTAEYRELIQKSKDELIKK